MPRDACRFSCGARPAPGGGEGAYSLGTRWLGASRETNDLWSRYCATRRAFIYSRPAPIACARGEGVVPSRIECLHNATLQETSPSRVTLLTTALARGRFASPSSLATPSVSATHPRKEPMNSRRATIAMRRNPPHLSRSCARALHVRLSLHDDARPSESRSRTISQRAFDVRHVEKLALCFTSAGDVI